MSKRLPPIGTFAGLAVFGVGILNFGWFVLAATGHQHQPAPDGWYVSWPLYLLSIVLLAGCTAAEVYLVNKVRRGR